MIRIDFKNGLLLVLYSILNTALTLSILYIINAKINAYQDELPANVGLIFFVIVGCSYLLNLFFQRRIIKFSYDFVYDNELKLTGKIQQLSLRQKDALGTERIYGILEDLRMFIYLAGVINNTLNSVLMILLCLGYLFTISVMGALLTVVLIGATALIYFVVGRKLSRKLNLLRNYNDHFNKFIDDLLRGFKELRISLARRNNLFSGHLTLNRAEAKALDTDLTNSFTAVNVLTQYGLYVIFGIILFLFPLLDILKEKEIASFIVVLLFMSGPINRLITMQNLFSRLRVASRRVKLFFKEIDLQEFKAEEHTREIKIEFTSLEFKNCVFRHHESFQLGPVNFSVKRGEVIFIIGGNGSGKSTFVNLLTGLYPPDEGAILLNGHPILNNTPAYQDLLSVVFTDNYIFSRNYDQYILDNNEKYKELLSFMEMDAVIKDCTDAAIRRRFSKGQSKRVSLILALLEDHPILVLDEWAADQDPYFRKFFYEKIVPWLKHEGKTIIAVTHDDAYFSYADRIVKFEDGNILSEIDVNEQSFNPTMLWSN